MLQNSQGDSLGNQSIGRVIKHAPVEGNENLSTERSILHTIQMLALYIKCLI